MPRQPFKTIYRVGMQYSIGSGEIEKRPELAALVALCISLWSDIELQLGLALGAILKANSEPATALFLSIKTSRAQREALESVARLLLAGDDLKDYEALTAVCAAVEKQRNSLAHGIFGTADSIPDGLLWSDLQDHANFLIRVYQAEYENRALADPHAQLRDEMFIYRKSDIEGLAADLREAQKAAFYFHCQHQPRPTRTYDYRAQFRALPLIAQELTRRA